jgi:hypothetical protein
MRSEELLDIKIRRPFQPHRFTFTTGEKFDLLSDKLMMVGRHFVTLGHPSRRDPRIADRIFTVSLDGFLTAEPICD